MTDNEIMLLVWCMTMFAGFLVCAYCLWCTDRDMERMGWEFEALKMRTSEMETKMEGLRDRMMCVCDSVDGAEGMRKGSDGGITVGRDDLATVIAVLCEDRDRLLRENARLMDVLTESRSEYDDRRGGAGGLLRLDDRGDGRGLRLHGMGAELRHRTDPARDGFDQAEGVPCGRPHGGGLHGRLLAPVPGGRESREGGVAPQGDRPAEAGERPPARASEQIGRGLRW